MLCYFVRFDTPYHLRYNVPNSIKDLEYIR